MSRLGTHKVNIQSGWMALVETNQSSVRLKELQKTYPFCIRTLTNIDEGFYAEADNTYSMSVVRQDKNLFYTDRNPNKLFAVNYYKNGESMCYYCVNDVVEAFVGFAQFVSTTKTLEIRDAEMLVREVKEFLDTQRKS